MPCVQEAPKSRRAFIDFWVLPLGFYANDWLGGLSGLPLLIEAEESGTYRKATLGGLVTVKRTKERGGNEIEVMGLTAAPVLGEETTRIDPPLALGLVGTIPSIEQTGDGVRVCDFIELDPVYLAPDRKGNRLWLVDKTIPERRQGFINSVQYPRGIPPALDTRDIDISGIVRGQTFYPVVENSLTARHWEQDIKLYQVRLKLLNGRLRLSPGRRGSWLLAWHNKKVEVLGMLDCQDDRAPGGFLEEPWVHATPDDSMMFGSVGDEDGEGWDLCSVDKVDRPEPEKTESAFPPPYDPAAEKEWDVISLNSMFSNIERMAGGSVSLSLTTDEDWEEFCDKVQGI